MHLDGCVGRDELERGQGADLTLNGAIACLEINDISVQGLASVGELECSMVDDDTLTSAEIGALLVFSATLSKYTDGARLCRWWTNVLIDVANVFILSWVLPEATGRCT